MPAVARPLAQRARERRRDALCHGETPLPRRRHQHPALALAALATAFVHVAIRMRARNRPATSPFQPSLTDPRNVQRFSRPTPSTRATAAAILPPSGAGETGFDSTGAIGKKKKAKKKPGDPHPLPPPPPPLPGPPQAAGGHTSAPQIKVRAAYADAYKPPDTPVRRPAPPLQDAFEPVGITRRHLSAEAVDRGHARLRHQSFARSERQGSAFTTVEPALKLQSEWSRHELRPELRGSYSRLRLAIVAEPAAGRRQEPSRAST